jgi:prevent-host-death family protein
MQKVGSRELKNRLGRFPRAVREGQSLIITDRGKPVAKLRPPDDAKSEKTQLQERLKELETPGFLRLAQKPLRKFRAVKGRGKLASQMIIEDRR